MSIRIDSESCTGCQACETSCPHGIIEVLDGKATINGQCDLCGACVDACSEEAIILEKKDMSKNITDISQYSGIWVIAEHYKGVINKVVFQLLGKGRELANILNVTLTLVILGDDFDDILEEFGLYGADDVLYVKSPTLKNYFSDLYTMVICDLISEYKPEIVLIGATPTGRDFAPRVAKRLNAGLTADCTGLEIDGKTKNLLQTRPTFGGNIMATIRTPYNRPQMATVRPGTFEMPEITKKKAKITTFSKFFDHKDSVIKIVKIITKKKSKRNLEDANIIVSGGRGVRSKENFKIIEELANVLGGEVGGSRVAVELGWISQNQQVGQTGKTVSPKLYIACGISGAIQHLVGMKNSSVIVAINRNPSAPIFSIAHYGIVDDLHKVVPALIKEIKRIRAEER
ncbi:MAG: FAD-binding protein [Promethearchaeota archaeon]